MISESLKQYSRSMNMTSKKYFKLNMTKKLFHEFKFLIDRGMQDIFQRTSVM